MEDYFQGLSTREKKLFIIAWLHLLVKPMTLKEMQLHFKKEENMIRGRKEKDRISGVSDLYIYHKLSVLLNKMLKHDLLVKLEEGKSVKRKDGKNYSWGLWGINESILTFESFSMNKEDIHKLIILIRQSYSKPIYLDLIKKLQIYEFATLIMIFNLYLTKIYTIDNTIDELANEKYIEHRVKGKTIYRFYKDSITDKDSKEFFMRHIKELKIPHINSEAILERIMNQFNKQNEIKHKEGLKLIKLNKTPCKEFGPDFYDYRPPKGYRFNIFMDKIQGLMPSLLKRQILFYNSIIARYYYKTNNITDNIEIFD